jgi:hypothetical protein
MKPRAMPGERAQTGLGIALILLAGALTLVGLDGLAD